MAGAVEIELSLIEDEERLNELMKLAATCADVELFREQMKP